MRSADRRPAGRPVNHPLGTKRITQPTRRPAKSYRRPPCQGPPCRSGPGASAPSRLHPCEDGGTRHGPTTAGRQPLRRACDGMRRDRRPNRRTRRPEKPIALSNHPRRCIGEGARARRRGPVTRRQRHPRPPDLLPRHHEAQLRGSTARRAYSNPGAPSSQPPPLPVQPRRGKGTAANRSAGWAPRRLHPPYSHRRNPGCRARESPGPSSRGGAHPAHPRDEGRLPAVIASSTVIP